MALCVMTRGTMRMPPWSADNWDSHPMVNTCIIHVLPNSIYDCYNYISTGAIPLSGEEFSEGSLPVLLRGTNCTGAESQLTQCDVENNITATSGCSTFQDAGVICQGHTNMTIDGLRMFKFILRGCTYIVAWNSEVKAFGRVLL